MIPRMLKKIGSARKDAKPSGATLSIIRKTEEIKIPIAVKVLPIIRKIFCV